MRAPEADNLRGAALMAVAALVFTLEALVVRWLSARGLPTEVFVAFRAGGQLVWVLPILARRGPALFRTRRAPMHLLRGVCSLVCWQLYYLSVAWLDLATATVLSFTNVVFTVMLAGPLLGERTDRWRWAGALIGLAGIAVMARPGGSADPWGVAAAIGSAIAWCGITLTSRSLTTTDGTATILAWVGAVTFAGSLPFAIAAWVPLAPLDLLVLVATTLVTPSIIWLVTEALRAGEASAVAPFQYLRLPLLALAGWLIYGEVPDAWGWLGAATILAGALVVTVAEARRR
jgi:drug/metabolite transporter (DMT)-like permease